MEPADDVEVAAYVVLGALAVLLGLWRVEVDVRVVAEGARARV